MSGILGHSPGIWHRHHLIHIVFDVQGTAFMTPANLNLDQEHHSANLGPSLSHAAFIMRKMAPWLQNLGFWRQLHMPKGFASPSSPGALIHAPFSYCGSSSDLKLNVSQSSRNVFPLGRTLIIKYVFWIRLYLQAGRALPSQSFLLLMM